LLESLAAQAFAQNGELILVDEKDAIEHKSVAQTVFSLGESLKRNRCGALLQVLQCMRDEKRLPLQREQIKVLFARPLDTNLNSEQMTQIGALLFELLKKISPLDLFRCLNVLNILPAIIPELRGVLNNEALETWVVCELSSFSRKNSYWPQLSFVTVILTLIAFSNTSTTTDERAISLALLTAPYSWLSENGFAAEKSDMTEQIADRLQDLKSIIAYCSP
jgi:hypothetical protein